MIYSILILCLTYNFLSTVKVAIKSKDLFDDDAGGVNNDDDYDMFA